MNNNRRHFIYRTTLALLGLAAGSAGLAAGETEAESTLRGMDRELAHLLRSYGRTHELERGGFQKAAIGAQNRRLPVSRVRVEVRNRASFQASFEKLAGLSVRVHVQGNTARFARAGRYYVIENRAA